MVARFIGHQRSGVQEINSDNNAVLSIYPNPVSSLFKVEAIGEGIKNIRIIDAFGREVMRLEADNNGDQTKIFTGTTSNIPNGVYYCIAQNGQQQFVRKLLVLH